MPPTIVANFWADYAAHIKQLLLRQGISMSGAETDNEIVHALFNRLGRQITAMPRVVHQPPGFSIPPRFKGCEAAIAAIKRDIEAGIDLMPRLSKKVRDFEYVDAMLADFDIQHFHLGSTLDADGFYARGAPLLYVRIDAADAYFVMVSGHGEWANVDFLEIIHTNWPASIERYRLKGAIAAGPNISAADRTKARNIGADSLIRMQDGTVYMPPGGGFSLGGASSGAAMRMAANRRALNLHEADMRQRVETLLAGRSSDQPVRISLVINEQEARAIEPISGLNEVLWGSNQAGGRPTPLES
jgi:hypothetical protein